MFNKPRSPVLVALIAILLGLVPAAMAQNGAQYEITVTNLTRGSTPDDQTHGQRFTPILVAVHKRGVKLFELGQPATNELKTLAEEGNTGPLEGLLSAMPEVVGEVVISGGLTDPGASKVVMVRTRGGFDHISIAAMLVPTNDGFFAVNGVEGPEGSHTLVLYSPAYDSGTEINDELCTSLPMGPPFTECGGPADGGAPGGGEGYVHVHAGIHGVGGVGSMNASLRDWRNPVAKIVIRRVH